MGRKVRARLLDLRTTTDFATTVGTRPSNFNTVQHFPPLTARPAAPSLGEGPSGR